VKALYKLSESANGKNPIIKLCVGYTAGSTARGAVSAKITVELCVAPSSLKDSGIFVNVAGSAGLLNINRLETSGYQLTEGFAFSVSKGDPPENFHTDLGVVETRQLSFGVLGGSRSESKSGSSYGGVWGVVTPGYSNSLDLSGQMSLTPRTIEKEFYWWYSEALKALKHEAGHEYFPSQALPGSP
jgi:hypothetical protein